MTKIRMSGEEVSKEIFNDKDSDGDDLEFDLGVDELEVVDADECNTEQSDVDAEMDDEQPAVSDHCAASSATSLQWMIVKLKPKMMNMASITQIGVGMPRNRDSAN